jgi:hypothetical protein
LLRAAISMSRIMKTTCICIRQMREKDRGGGWGERTVSNYTQNCSEAARLWLGLTSAKDNRLPCQYLHVRLQTSGEQIWAPRGSTSSSSALKLQCCEQTRCIQALRWICASLIMLKLQCTNSSNGFLSTPAGSSNRSAAARCALLLSKEYQNL